MVSQLFVYALSCLGLPVVWYKLGMYDVDDVRDRSFTAGVRVSQRFRKYPAWDRIVEPFILKQTTTIFIAGHSFIEGLVSDNPPSQNMKAEIRKMDSEIDKIVHKKH